VDIIVTIQTITVAIFGRGAAFSRLVELAKGFKFDAWHQRPTSSCSSAGCYWTKSTSNTFEAHSPYWCQTIFDSPEVYRGTTPVLIQPTWNFAWTDHWYAHASSLGQASDWSDISYPGNPVTTPDSGSQFIHRCHRHALICVLESDRKTPKRNLTTLYNCDYHWRSFFNSMLWLSNREHWDVRAPTSIQNSYCLQYAAWRTAWL
jgi:hypothetical protein